MIIEIRKAGFTNKGAELMLLAALERMREAYPDAVFTMTPTADDGAMPFRKVVDAGFYPKASLFRFRRQWADLLRFTPKKRREMYGLVLDKEIDVVLDAAGFSYSDQWGPGSAAELSWATRRWKNQGTKVILLPQAFGPFSNTRIKTSMSHSIANVDLVCARDQLSLEYLTELAGESANIKKYPDFTNLLEGVVPEYFDRESCKVCLVPNYRMVDKTADSEGNAYIPFMIRCAKILKERDARPFLLIHEGANDLKLAQIISEAVEGMPVILEDDPVKIKGVLGASYASVGSRFHGLVSALSQGVPSFATSWSHKYQELFRDYDFPDGILDVGISDNELLEKIDWLIDEKNNREMSTSLISASNNLKSLTHSMWDEVFSIVN